MRPRMAQQLEPVLLRSRERALMRIDDVFGVVLEPSETNEAFSNPLFRGSGNNKALEVSNEGWGWHCRDDVRGAPIPQESCSSCVDIVPRIVAMAALPQNDPHNVVRIQRVIALLHFLGNLVVRLRN